MVEYDPKTQMAHCANDKENNQARTTPTPHMSRSSLRQRLPYETEVAPRQKQNGGALRTRPPARSETRCTNDFCIAKADVNFILERCPSSANSASLALRNYLTQIALLQECHRARRARHEPRGMNNQSSHRFDSTTCSSNWRCFSRASSTP